MTGPDDPPVVAAVAAIHTGDVEALEQLLAEHPGLSTARLGSSPDGTPTTAKSRTLLHVATDWPGHFPRGPAIVMALIAAGAEVDARFVGRHRETPLHWAASSDDVDVLDVLIDAGADIEADGRVIGGGTPLADAVAFGQWNAARRLVDRGARARSGRPRHSGCWTGSRTLRRERRRQRPRSPERSGPRATAANDGRRSSCSNGAPTSTGSATTT